jgi:hypothetical protein
MSNLKARKARNRVRRSVVEKAARLVRRLSKPGTPERLFTVTAVQLEMGLNKTERNALSDELVRLSSSDSLAFGRTRGKKLR